MAPRRSCSRSKGEVAAAHACVTVDGADLPLGLLRRVARGDEASLVGPSLGAVEQREPDDGRPSSVGTRRAAQQDRQAPAGRGGQLEPSAGRLTRLEQAPLVVGLPQHAGAGRQQVLEPGPSRSPAGRPEPVEQRWRLTRSTVPSAAVDR